jgi:2',3'-cyclic-nucleotide 2'-phosphodiesterase / 3'-nucleotidase
VLPFFGPAAHPRKLPVRVDLRLIQTTDLHGHVLSYDYLGDRASDRVGLARLAHLIRAARTGAVNSVLMDTGDALTGSALGDLTGTAGSGIHGAGPEIHPMIAAMNYLGHDAATLGNHDFNFGLDPLLQCLAAARFPVLCANVATHPGQSPCDDRTFLPPWSILSRRVTDRDGMDHDLRIGVIGLVPPQIDQWDRHHLDGRVWTRDIVEAATAHLPALRAAGADLVIALCHSGIAAGPARPRQENAALQVAALPGVDVLLCGHQHQLFPGPAFEGISGVNVRAGTLHGKPAVMAGFWGAHLGVIDLELTLAADGWRLAGHRSTIWPAGTGRDRRDSGDDPAIVALAQPAHARTLARLRRSVGHSKAPVHSYFALVADDPSIQLVAEAQRLRVAHLLAGTAEAGLPLLSAVAPFKAGGAAGPAYYTNVPAGPLSIGSLSDLYLFPNVLRAVRVSGATLLDWLEHAAGQFNRLRPGQPDQILRNPQFPSYNFDVICGLRYVIDPTQPARFSPEGQLQDAGARRISQVTCDGRPVLGCDEFIVATNSFRVDGGGGFAAARQMHSVRLQGQADQTIPEVLLAYIRQRGKFTPRTRPVWRFAPSPGTSALFDSAPAAAAALAGVRGPQIEWAGPAPGGFARFRLHF